MDDLNLKQRPWLSCWLITSIFIMLFPHSLDINTGVHYHDEEIIEDWIEVHEEGYIVVPAHSTAGQTVDAIPLVVQSNWNGLKFNFEQRPAYLAGNSLMDVTVCVSDFYNTPITNGSLYIAPLEEPDFALDSWLDENGCSVFIARQIQNQLLIFDLKCNNSITPEVCNGSLIIPANIGKLWNMNIQSKVSEKITIDDVKVKVLDIENNQIQNQLELWSDQNKIENYDDNGNIIIPVSQIIDHNLSLKNIQHEHSMVNLYLDDILLEIIVENNTADIPKLVQQNIQITTTDQHFWPWKNVAISILLDDESGEKLVEIGGTDSNGKLSWQGFLPEGTHQIVGMTTNETVELPASSAYSTTTGSPTYLSRFSVGNSLFLSLFSSIGILYLAGTLSLSVLAIGCWNILRRVTDSTKIHWISAGLVNLNGCIIIISHADLMSDLHATSFLVLGISLLIQFYSECTDIKAVDQWWPILASGLLIGLSISIRFVNLFYAPIILLASILVKPNNLEKETANLKTRMTAFIVLTICISLALTPTLVYQENQHGNAFKYSASKGEIPPGNINYDYQWNSATSYILSINSTENQNTTNQTSPPQDEDTQANVTLNEPAEDTTNAAEEFTTEFGDSFGKITSQERSYFAQISTIILFSLAYCPILILALLITPLTWNKENKENSIEGININNVKVLMICWITWGLFSLIIDRSPFYVSHWNDDVRYFTPIVAPAAILLGIIIVEQKEYIFSDYRKPIAFVALTGLCSIIVSVPRLLWEGTRRPMSKSMGLETEGRFDLTNLYTNTNTPHWILDAQYAWHPFTERLAFATYEIFAIIISISMISFITWSYFKYQKVDFTDSEE